MESNKTDKKYTIRKQQNIIINIYSRADKYANKKSTLHGQSRLTVNVHGAMINLMCLFIIIFKQYTRPPPFSFRFRAVRHHHRPSTYFIRLRWFAKCLSSCSWPQLYTCMLSNDNRAIRQRNALLLVGAFRKTQRHIPDDDCARYFARGSSVRITQNHVYHH